MSDLHLLAEAASLHDALAQRGIDAGPDAVDLSLGTPVDPTPQVARDALAAAADAPGYPLVWGTPPLREAVTAWYDRHGVPGLDPDGVLPTIGSKEAIAWLPTLLGLGPGDDVVHPELAYPTYAAGAYLAGARPVPTADPTALPGAALAWVNSPGNPHGRVAPVDEMRAVVAWARSTGTLLVSDECYLELGWDAEPVSLLDPRVCDGDVTGLLACYSLSKQSNLAGYRAGFLAGDPALVRRLVEVRKHAGMIVSRPVQAVMAAVLGDSAHVAEQRERYRARRTTLRAAVEAAGLRVDHSEGGLYLWCTRDEPDWETVAALARTGVLVAPGSFYGPAGARHVRLALTASDAAIATAADRLATLA
jgi:succinyldiaminopimelate transaminase